MKLDYLEVKGIYLVNPEKTLETVNRVLYEEGDTDSEVVDAMSLIQDYIEQQFQVNIDKTK